MSIFGKTLSVLGISSLFFGAAFAGGHHERDRCRDDCKKNPKFSFEFSETANPQEVFNGEVHQGTYVTRNGEGERIDYGTYYSYVIQKENCDCDQPTVIQISRLFGQCGVVKATLFHNPCDCKQDKVKFAWGHGVYECWSHSCEAKSGEKTDCNHCHDHSWWKFRLVEDECCRARHKDDCWKEKEDSNKHKWDKSDSTSSDCRKHKWDKCDSDSSTNDFRKFKWDNDSSSSSSCSSSSSSSSSESCKDHRFRRHR